MKIHVSLNIGHGMCFNEVYVKGDKMLFKL